MTINPFTFSRCPHIIFGQGKIKELGKIADRFGKTALLITGGFSFKKSGKFDVIIKNLQKNSINHFHYTVTGEPSPALVDKAVKTFKEKHIDFIISIGGGSVIDAGKAISAMMPSGDSVMDYIEGVGKGKIHNGNKLPFIAIPTTSGTGSEATKNAVLSRIGSDGFKKSLRRDNFVPDVALIDAELMKSCPPGITASCGMDALAQLLGSYVSTKASPLTDYIALSGLKYVKGCFIPVCSSGAKNLDMRAGMAYGSLMSGITLANAGLGIVHGLASPIGGYFNIPHGVVCGTLLAPATEINIKKLRKMKKANETALNKYAVAGVILSGKDRHNQDKNCNLLIKTLYDWSEALNIPLLSDYGIKKTDFDKIIADASNKNNPINLENDDIEKILLKRIK